MSTINPSVRAIEARIKGTSKLAAVVLGVVVVVVPVLLALYVSSDLAAQDPWVRLLNVLATALTPASRLVLFVTMLGSLIPLLWGLWELRRLFLGYAAGEVFTEMAAIRFGRFALALMLTAIASPVSITVLSLAFSKLGTIPPSAVISISSTDILLLLAGCLMRIVASVLRGAACLAEENAAFF